MSAVLRLLPVATEIGTPFKSAPEADSNLDRGLAKWHAKHLVTVQATQGLLRVLAV
jgi:hypothetical protein